MSTFYSGQNGRLLIDGTTAGKVTNWSISSSMSPLTTTTLEDTDQTFISGLRNTTGSCRLYYYDDDSGTTEVNSAQTLISKVMKVRSDITAAGDPGVAAAPDLVTLKLQIVDGGTTREVAVEVLITSASMAMAVGEVLAADIAFQVNGAPTVVNLI